MKLLVCILFEKYLKYIEKRLPKLRYLKNKKIKDARDRYRLGEC